MNVPPFVVFANRARRTPPATHVPSAGLDPVAHADLDEDIETERLDRDAMRAMIARGEIVDVKTIGGLALLPKD